MISEIAKQIKGLPAPRNSFLNMWRRVGAFDASSDHRLSQLKCMRALSLSLKMLASFVEHILSISLIIVFTGSATSCSGSTFF